MLLTPRRRSVSIPVGVRAGLHLAQQHVESSELCGAVGELALRRVECVAVKLRRIEYRKMLDELP
jgi:hypothetical protein